jgi:hypothetical protein
MEKTNSIAAKIKRVWNVIARQSFAVQAEFLRRRMILMLIQIGMESRARTIATVITSEAIVAVRGTQFAPTGEFSFTT